MQFHTFCLNKRRHPSPLLGILDITRLLDMPNVTVKRCTVLNPASLLPTPDDGEEHNCLAELQALCTPPPDMTDTPLDNPGSATGLNRVGFSVVSDSETLRSGPLPSHYSAQAAELTALTKACKFSAGNARADAAAKAAARPPPPPQLPDKPLISVALLQTHVSLPDSLPSTLSQLQSLSTPEENHLWSSSGCTFSDAVWWGPNGHPCLPKHFFPHFAKLTHGLDHVSKGGMLSMVDQYWFTKSFSIFAQKHCQACVTCATHNVGRPVQVSAQAAHPPPTRPFEHMMMDFIELDPSEGKKHCLVMVDMWSKRVEAFPASKQTAGVVAKALLTEIIPRWGIPSRLSTDNGTHLDTQGFVVSDAPYSL
ncbi:uncharacterized protein LOC118319863 isoform X3 [Scophthalmus maximus]|uniref:uncharacterized protein LOC118319863 isoform X3 n=1 Tax=Scophthalmus maximus TaxID=52904 RepID=UPI001FA861E4|nr:uncharacterized protein LOC118319863 isoform X3 [Scophthalmus maximus]XP_047190647.1 uncharacterized protein LOC118319863 isoform X3 [Scophthalmus maximus]